MNLSFAVVFAMAAAHAVNYMVYQMEREEHKKAKRASMVALHSTLAKLANQTETRAGHNNSFIGSTGGLTQRTGGGVTQRSNVENDGSTLTFVHNVEEENAAIGTTGNDPDDDVQKRPYGKDYQTARAFDNKTPVPTPTPGSDAADNGMYAATMAAQEAIIKESGRSICCKAACSPCTLCTLISHTWAKMNAARKIDIVITLVCAAIYIAGTVWIFSWRTPSSTSAY
jgi:hypothetical protein